MSVLYVVRGLPGSGKTTLAKKLVGENRCFSADDWFTDSKGEYHFNSSELQMAHEACQNNTLRAMILKAGDVAVHNTFSTQWETDPYIEMAKENNYTVCVIECQNNFGNVHNVPLKVIESMRKRWESISV